MPILLIPSLTDLREGLVEVRHLARELLHDAMYLPDEHPRIPGMVSGFQHLLSLVLLRFFPKANHPVNF